VKLLFKKLFLHSPKAYIVAFAIATAFVLINLVVKGFYMRICYVDAFTTSGAITFLIGMLILVAHYGAFDTFAYSFSRLRGKKYDSLYDFSTEKNEKRAKGNLIFMPFIAVGIVFIAVGLIIGAGM